QQYLSFNICSGILLCNAIDNTSKVETLGVIGCISAVGLAIAENLFSFTKIAKKLKTLLKQVEE
ncbi:hypothetical protein MC059_27920, partial [Paenibacillus alvei]|nr:hypothetical protein [Paenibacillus alvei]